MEYFKARDKRKAVNKAEAEDKIADSVEVRLELIAKMGRGEMTLEQMQAELKRVQRNAKKNGLVTRSQAFRRA